MICCVKNCPLSKKNKERRKATQRRRERGETTKKRYREVQIYQLQGKMKVK